MLSRAWLVACVHPWGFVRSPPALPTLFAWYQGRQDGLWVQGHGSEGRFRCSLCSCSTRGSSSGKLMRLCVVVIRPLAPAGWKGECMLSISSIRRAGRGETALATLAFRNRWESVLRLLGQIRPRSPPRWRAMLVGWLSSVRLIEVLMKQTNAHDKTPMCCEGKRKMVATAGGQK